MNKEELKIDIEKWVELCKKTDALHDKISAIFGVVIDSEPFNLYYEMLELIQKSIEEKHGIEGDWLSYFWHECNFGENPMEVTFKCGKVVVVKDVDSIIEVILGE